MRYCLSGLCLKRVKEQLELRSTETKGGRFRRTPNQGRKRDSHSRRLPFKPSLPSSWIDFSVLDSISFRRREKLELLSSSRDRTTPGYGGWDEGGRVVAIEEGHLIQPKREDGESECQKEKMKKDWSSKGKRDASSTSHRLTRGTASRSSFLNPQSGSSKTLSSFCQNLYCSGALGSFGS